MNIMEKLNLKQAITSNQLDKFIKEHKDLAGDEEKLEDTIMTMADISTPTHQTSVEADDEN